MAKINGMEMPEPSSGGGGSLTNALMGIFRERTRAQKQLEMMAYGSAIDVAGKITAEEKIGDVRRKGLQQDFKEIFARHPEGHPQAGEYVNPELVQHVNEAGLEVTPSGIRFSPSSLTKLEQMRARTGPFAQYGPRESAKTSSAKVRKRTTKAEETDTTVNGQAQTVGEANVGNRKPAASKGGYIRPSKRGSRKPAPTAAPVATGTATAPSSYGGEGTAPIINPASPVAGVNQPKSNAPRAKRASKKPGRGQMPPAGGTNA